MRFSTSLLAAAFCAVLVQGKAPLESILVSYDKNTADSVVEAAKKAIIDAGGEITHEYSIFKGFAALAPAEAKASVASVDGATVEVDQEMHIASGSKP
ncbi:hypothetical protein K461DRAFT_319261 [Myriangium duriaei CBS 260.36]|uniref:Inhibitor I9 domain-containing protein n=1 Tax=Myriangium duriaei CBS 260.36 TaxID=1168546 RepID=A0A9P4MIX3_9PEZI|nr:hypothetical protein K461DRAFT_319261 [Myriangium duriaei CBS 260.36]